MQTQASSDRPQVRQPLAGAFAPIYRNSHLLFLVVLVLFSVATPFIGTLSGGELVNAALLTLVMASGLLVIQARRGTLMLAMLLVVPAVVARWINYSRPDLVPAAVHLAFGMLFLALVAVQFLRFILRAPRVTAQVLEAGISTYLVFGLLWALAYMTVGHLNPDAFAFTAPGNSMNGFNALYYSFVTLTTMGYGDILPVSRVARMLAIMEATTGVLYMSVLIARLVGMYSTVTPIRDDSDTERSSSGSNKQ